MTLLPAYRICPSCKRMYSWNPDVGKTSCPYCNAKKTREGIEKIVEIITGKKRGK